MTNQRVFFFTSLTHSFRVTISANIADVFCAHASEGVVICRQTEQHSDQSWQQQNV